MDFFGATTGSEEKANAFLAVCNRVMHDSFRNENYTMDLAFVSGNGVVTLETECLFKEIDNDGYDYKDAVMEYIKEHPADDFSGYCACVLTSDGNVHYHSYLYR